MLKMSVNKVIIILILSVLFMSDTILAQKSVEFKARNFPRKKKELDKALSELREGDAILKEVMKGNPGLAEQALPHYLDAYAFNPNNLELNHSVGICYYLLGKTLKAKPFFKKSVSYDSSAYINDLLYLAQAYHLDKEWDKAIWLYEKYLMLNAGRDLVSTPMGDVSLLKSIRECRHGKTLQTKLPSAIVKLADSRGIKLKVSPFLNLDGSEAWFTMTEPGMLSSDSLDIPELREGIYVSVRRDSIWTFPDKPSSINSEETQKIVYLSPDGQKMLLWRPAMNGDLYETFRVNGQWTTPKSLGKGVNSEYRESSAALTPDGNTVFFTSNRPGGKGSMDIWYSRRNSDNTWTQPKNAGEVLNTEFNEEYLYLHIDGHTLYFSSRGHNSIGGYDLFRTDWIDSSFSKPENIGLPVNSPADELSVSFSADGLEGYFVSNRGIENDPKLYQGVFKGMEKQAVLLETNPVLSGVNVKEYNTISYPDICKNCSRVRIIHATVTDKNGKAIQSEIVVKNKATKTVSYATKTYPADGKTWIVLQSGKSLAMYIMADGYVMQALKEDPDKNQRYIVESRNFTLDKLEENKEFRMPNVRFQARAIEFDKGSVSDLEAVYEFLQRNPGVRLEFRVCGAESEKSGSQRAKSVMEWFERRGIPSRRVSWASCDKSEGCTFYQGCVIVRISRI